MNINFDIKKKNLGVFAIFMILGLVIGYVGATWPLPSPSVSHDSAQIKVDVDGVDYDLQEVVNDLDANITQLEVDKASIGYVAAATQTSFVYTVWGSSANCAGGHTTLYSGRTTFATMGTGGLSNLVCSTDIFSSAPGAGEFSQGHSNGKGGPMNCKLCLAP